MIEIVKFQTAHLAMIEVQSAQAYATAFVSDEQALLLEQNTSYTAVKDGVPIAAAGILELWPNRGAAWAYLSETGPKAFLTIHRTVTKFLDECKLRRVEMVVEYGHNEAHRWARMLGFTLENPFMEAYTPDGRDFSLYARVQ